MSDLTQKEQSRNLVAEAPTESQISDNVFVVLAQRASERSPAELWTTAIGGSVNAAVVFARHPHLHWLGAGFVAAAAYGIWGLANRAIVTQSTRVAGVRLDLLRGLRGMMVPIGIVSAIVAMGSFMGVALGGWIH